MTRTMIEAPDWPKVDSDLMSNFDREVDREVEQRLRNEKVIAGYPGWNFHATCWYTNGLFHAQVGVYNVHVDTFSAPTPDDLMVLVCQQYGRD